MLCRVALFSVPFHFLSFSAPGPEPTGPTGLSGNGDLDFHSCFNVDDDLLDYFGGGVQAVYVMLVSDL